MSAELTLGAEEELHLIDLELWELSARAPQLLSRLPKDLYAAEIQRTTVETNTPVVRSLADFRTELVRLRKGVIDVAAQEGLGIAAVGTAARSTYADFELTSTGRYSKMQEEYRLLVDEQLICGTQVHVGVSDRDLAVQILQRIAPELPVLLAISASSPYWNGLDTGYASIRSIIWQRWPTAGSAGPLDSAAQYDELVDDLVRSGVIGDAKMVYFDVRPSSHAPTLELRVCDACPLVDDAVLIAGLFRGIVRAAEVAIESGLPFTAQSQPLHRAALWQAARSGLSRNLVHVGARPVPRPAHEVVRDLVSRLRPQLEELGDWETVTELAESVLARGNSADRQRAAYAERGSLEDVMRLVVAESHGQTSDDLASLPALRRYRLRAGDEALGPGSVARPAYRDVVTALVGHGPDELRQRVKARDSWVARKDLTYVVDGVHQPFEIDLFPRILGPHEWAELEVGLTQRAWAIESFIRDVYGEQRILDDGVLPRDVVLGSPGWREEGTRLPAGVVRAPVMGFDLVRNEYGRWRVLEDNVRSPSGVAFAIAIRALMDEVMPDMPRPPGIAHPAAGYELLRATLLAHAVPGTRAALLTNGPASGAWFEHRHLSDGAGLTRVLPEDVVIADGMLIDRKSDVPIGVLYLRLDGELVDLRDGSGRAIGAQIMDIAANGGVVLANAPGNGVADDKSTYPFLPELITYYLGERPLLESVPTYRPADPAERSVVLGRVGELVTKPVEGFGGAGVLIGPAATAAEVAARRAEIVARPQRWVAQEVVALSSLPCLADGHLEPRHVDLRAFVYLTGPGREDARLAPLGLTRVAPAGSLIVNSSQGGGAKDTWIVTQPTDEGR